MSMDGIAEPLERQVEQFCATAQGLVGPGYFRVRRLEFALQRMLQPQAFASRFEHALELGCGLGYKALLWSGFADEVVGVDMPTTYHGFASRQPAAQAGQDILERVGASRVSLRTGELLPFLADTPETFDLIYSDYLLEHIEDPATLCRAVHRALRPGGTTLHIVPVASLAYMELARTNASISLASLREAVAGTFKRWLGRERRTASLTPNGWLLPLPHSEFACSFAEQIGIYTLERSLFPMIEAGLTIKAVTPVRDTAVSVWAVRQA